MAWFQLDPQSIAARAKNAPVPSLGASILRGVTGFTLVSVAGFSPWALFDRWFHRFGEIGLYLACAIVFMGLSGILLHRLILGSGSLPRFYKIFSLAFAAYAVAWVAFWMWLRGDAGSLGGLLGGTAVMGLLLACAFDAPRSIVKIVAALFVGNTLGYYAGGWIEAKMPFEHKREGMLLWGVCYGLGFGAGLGLAFYFCQEKARALISRGDS